MDEPFAWKLGKNTYPCSDPLGRNYADEDEEGKSNSVDEDQQPRGYDRQASNDLEEGRCVKCDHEVASHGGEGRQVCADDGRLFEQSHRDDRQYCVFGFPDDKDNR